MKRIAIAFVIGLILCSLSSCTPEETISVIKIESDISNLEVEESSSSSVESEPAQSSEVSEQMNTSSEDYKLDKTITIDGTTYTLKYETTSKRSGGQWNDRHIYWTPNNELFDFDVETGKLLSFYLHIDEEAGNTVSEQEAIEHAEEFLKTQVDLTLFKQETISSKDGSYAISYVRPHLGYKSEFVDIEVSKQGKIESFWVRYDTDRIVLSVKELDMQKVNQALSELTGESNFEYEIQRWAISKNNKPALDVSCHSLDSDKYKNVVVEINSDNTYSAYEEPIYFHG